MSLEWLDAGPDGARDVRIVGAAGRPVTGAVWMPDDVTASTPLVLCLHGASGDRYQVPIPDLATRFRARGAATVSLDGPVHGLRQQGPGGRVALNEAFRRPELVDEMVSDWLELLDAVRAEMGLQGNPLAYYGLSMGAVFGIPTLAAARARGTAFRASVLGLLGTTGAVGFLADRLLDDAAAIDHPVLYLMQLEDELFDRDGYLALFDALATADKRLHANPGLHPEIPDEEVDAAVEFLAARFHDDVPRLITNPLAE